MGKVWLRDWRLSAVVASVSAVFRFPFSPFAVSALRSFHYVSHFPFRRLSQNTVSTIILSVSRAALRLAPPPPRVSAARPAHLPEASVATVSPGPGELVVHRRDTLSTPIMHCNINITVITLILTCTSSLFTQMYRVSLGFAGRVCPDLGTKGPCSASGTVLVCNML